jgi:hypothetical protein
MEEDSLRSAWSSWEAYSTDPFRHDGIDTDDEYDTNCNTEDNYIMDSLISNVIKLHPRLSKHECDIRDWIKSY